MANNFKLSATLQNTYDASRTVKAVRHRIPEVNFSQSAVVSAVKELTGTASITIQNNGGDLEVGGVIVPDPTNPSLGIRIVDVLGWAIYVDRAAAATAPTGSVSVTVSNFGLWYSDGTIPLKEGAAFIYHNPNQGISFDTDSLTVSLSGTTGYKVSVLVYCEPEP